MSKVKIGIIGCGCISGIYLQNLTKVFDNTEVVAVCDLIEERALKAKEDYGIPYAFTTDEEILAMDEIEIIVNLTTPHDHYAVNKMALEAGKNVHVEKPFSITTEQGKELLALARSKGLYIGGAPDTFMGASFQSCRRLIEEGAIGDPIAAVAFMTCRGHESWHPDPEFYYEVGGGPMFDMGPYYLTGLINLMGPVESVMGETRITFPTRTITSEKKNGKIINVEVPTHVAGLMSFENGAVASIITSFDIYDAHLPRIEIYGSKGSLSVPDPNCFSGPVLLRTAESAEWKEISCDLPYAENSRGIGVSDMADAIKNKRKNRASGDLAFHVLEIMHGFHISSAEGRRVTIESTCDKPAAL